MLNQPRKQFQTDFNPLPQPAFIPPDVTFNPQMAPANPKSNLSEQTAQKFVEGLSDDAMLAFQKALINEYREKHPELGEYELYIAAEVNDLLEKAQQNGILISPREAIEFGIRRFKEKVTSSPLLSSASQDLSSDKKQDNNDDITPEKPASTPVTPSINNKQDSFSSREVNRLALNMDLSSNPASIGKLSPEDIWNMPREQFLELDRKIRQQHYR